MGRFVNQQRLFLSASVLILVLIGGLPLVVMVVKSLTANGHVSLAAYHQLFSSPRIGKLMVNSFTLSALVTAMAMVTGVPLGIVLEKAHLPFRRLWALIFTFPLLIPPYILAVAWLDLLGREGMLSRLWGTEVSVITSRWLFSLGGNVWILWTTFLPIPMLLTMLALRTVHPHLEEAGRLIARWPRVLCGITLPTIRPVLWLAAILVFLLTFGEYGVPNFLRFDVFPVESFTQFSAFYNFQAAVAAAIPLLGITLIIILIEAHFLKARTYQLRPAPHAGEALPIELGKFRMLIVGSIISLALVTVLLPLLALIIRAGNWHNYLQAIKVAAPAMKRSIIFATLGATLLLVLGFLNGYWIQRRAMKGWRWVDSLALFLFALPGTVTGIGLITLWNTAQTAVVYGTPIIILFGYVAKYTALSNRIVVSHLAQLPVSVEEAARIAGAGWFRRLLQIVAPLTSRGLLTAWLVGFIFTLRDADITMLVYPPGQETLPVAIYTLMANGDPAFIAALCLLLVAVVVLLVLFALLVLHLKKESL